MEYGPDTSNNIVSNAQKMRVSSLKNNQWSWIKWLKLNTATFNSKVSLGLILNMDLQMTQRRSLTSAEHLRDSSVQM